MSKNWNFAEVWNKGLDNKVERPVEPRDYLWASELGKAPIDVYLRLKGTKPTNPPNKRSMRKFEAGNIFEWLVSLILKRAGILISEQDHVTHQYTGLLKVTGRVDFIAGGTPDFPKAIAEMKALDMPDMFIRIAEEMKVYFDANYPSVLIVKPLEIKSLSAFMFEGLMRRQSVSKNHRLQAYHYMKARGDELGSVVYICRDDMRLMEFDLQLNLPVLENEYYNSIKVISDYYLKDEMPPLEKMILFDEDMGKFVKNWNVAYSGYLTMLYGFKNQAEYDGKYAGTVTRWNTAVTRFKAGKKMSKLNIESIEGMTLAGFDPAKIVGKFVEPLPDEEETE